MVGFELGSVGVFGYDKESSSLKRVAWYKPGLFNYQQPKHIVSDGASVIVVAKTRQSKKIILSLEHQLDDTLQTLCQWNTNQLKTVTSKMVCVTAAGNKILACLEVNEKKETELQFYLLNLEAKEIEKINRTLINCEVYSMIQASGGVVLFTNTSISYRKPGSDTEIVCDTPQRLLNCGSSQNVSFSAFTKQSETVTLLLSTKGELYELVLEIKENDVYKMNINFFCIVPKATGLCILSNQFIFLFCDFGS